MCLQTGNMSHSGQEIHASKKARGKTVPSRTAGPRASFVIGLTGNGQPDVVFLQHLPDISRWFGIGDKQIVAVLGIDDNRRHHSKFASVCDHDSVICLASRGARKIGLIHVSEHETRSCIDSGHGQNRSANPESLYEIDCLNAE
jgi:hypothetical protein